MNYKIEEVEGIGPAYGEKLSGAGIANTGKLLEVCGGAAGRKSVAEKTGISEKLLLQWANQADLMRIKGVGKQFAELLEAAGVDTVKELKHRNAANLAVKMAEVNGEKKLTRATPREDQVADWVEQAKTMEPRISH